MVPASGLRTHALRCSFCKQRSLSSCNLRRRADWAFFRARFPPRSEPSIRGIAKSRALWFARRKSFLTHSSALNSTAVFTRASSTYPNATVLSFASLNTVKMTTKRLFGAAIWRISLSHSMATFIDAVSAIWRRRIFQQHSASISTWIFSIGPTGW